MHYIVILANGLCQFVWVSNQSNVHMVADLFHCFAESCVGLLFCVCAVTVFAAVVFCTSSVSDWFPCRPLDFACRWRLDEPDDCGAWNCCRSACTLPCDVIALSWRVMASKEQQMSIAVTSVMVLVWSGFLSVCVENKASLYLPLHVIANSEHDSISYSRYLKFLLQQHKIVQHTSSIDDVWNVVNVTHVKVFQPTPFALQYATTTLVDACALLYFFYTWLRCPSSWYLVNRKVCSGYAESPSSCLRVGNLAKIIETEPLFLLQCTGHQLQKAAWLHCSWHHPCVQ